MSRSTKTARGRTLDMAAMVAQNEDTRAVSNIRMNAKGDRINSDGSVKIKAEDLARVTQTVRTTPSNTAVSDPIPAARVVAPSPVMYDEPVAPVEPVGPTLEAISRITRTRDDGTKYAEIEYDDGSIETEEVEEE